MLMEKNVKSALEVAMNPGLGSDVMENFNTLKEKRLMRHIIIGLRGIFSKNYREMNLLKTFD